MKYKLRAECMADVVQFIEIADINNTSFKRKGMTPDVEFMFNTNMSLPQIIEKIKLISDSHVMYQTVQPIKYYTGKRNYNL